MGMLRRTILLAWCGALIPAWAYGFDGLPVQPLPFGELRSPTGADRAWAFVRHLPELAVTEPVPPERAERRPGAPEATCEATPPAGTRVQVERVRPGDSPWRVFTRAGVPSAGVNALVKGFRKNRRMVRLGLGEEISVGFDGDLPVWARHRIGSLDAWCGAPGPAGHWLSRAVVVPERRRWVALTGSLLHGWEAAIVAGGWPRHLAAVPEALFPQYAPSIDPKSPPTFRVAVEIREVEGEVVGYGPVGAVEVTNGRTSRGAYRFSYGRDPDAYYDRDGSPFKLRRLRPPVLDAVLTSGFGLRRHPIRRRWRNHNGVDYGAPRGTPVFAVASGTVKSAGRRGVFGRLVVLDHPGFTTRYAHLSRIADLRPGDPVEAGQLIGYVGSSGLSTGPHLHFETWVGGRPVDPERFSPPRPMALSDTDLERFRAHVSRLLAAFDPKVS